jgi:hypothetical protein
MTPELQFALELFCATLAIYCLVRLLKVGSLAEKIPARFRPLIALLLGGMTSVVEAFAVGRDWGTALTIGLIGATSAMSGHDLFIHGARDGREIGRPKP